MTINTTPPGHLAEYLVGDLGPARRHLYRLLGGDGALAHYMPQDGPLRGILLEISESIGDCVERIGRDVPPLERKAEDDHK